LIYFFQPIAGGPVKIGSSKDITRRHEQLEAYYGCPLTILGTMPGERDKEREIHERFAHLRLGRTEQFRPTNELMKFIGRPLLVSANPDIMEAIPPIRPSNLKHIRVQLSEKHQAKLRIAAAQSGMSMAAYARAILVEAIDGSKR
jgi:hypothetical protein